ncbi:MAG: aldo/keto reductase [Chitinivibrionales bacterium]|nr:aldo/keto reductase [Chitinivibrionales bacterium]
MKLRPLTKYLPKVTEIGLGCWQLGGGWGNPCWDDEIAQKILLSAYNAGIRFFDTADVYGGGQSELSLGRFRTTHPDILVATKLGRTPELYPDGFTKDGIRRAISNSIERLKIDRIDLVQLHCVPRSVLEAGSIFDWLREIRHEGLIRAFGASVESIEEGRICLEQEGLSSLQIIFNIFRQKPITELLPFAQAKEVGVIVRLPLSSGLLTGKISKGTRFGEHDHRHFNRDGRCFNVGETFSRIAFEKGVEMANQVKKFVPERMTMTQMAVRWVLDHEAVSVVIPGASTPGQAEENAAISNLTPLSEELHCTLDDFYRKNVQQYIRGPY